MTSKVSTPPKTNNLNLQQFLPKLFLAFIVVYFLYSRAYGIESKFGFDHDQEKAAEAVWSLIKDKNLSLIGIETSTGGLFAGPFLNWSHAVFLLLFRFDPIALAYQAIIFSAATVLFLFLFIYKTIGKFQAYICAFLYVVSERLIPYDYSGSPISYMTFHSLMVFILYYFVVHKKYQSLLPLLAFTLSLGYHIHFVLLLQIPTVVLLIIAHKTKFSLKNILMSLIIFCLPFSTAFLFELKHNFLMTGNFVSMLTTQKYVPMSPLDKTHSFLSFLLETVVKTDLLFLKLAIFTAIVVVLIKSGITSKVTKDLACFILIPFAFILLYRGPMTEYYFLPVVVPFIVLLSIAFSTLYKTHRIIVLLLCSLIFLINFTNEKHHELNAHSLKVKRDVVEKVKGETSRKNVKIILDIPLSYNFGFNYLFKLNNINSSPDAKEAVIISYSERQINKKDELINKNEGIFGYFVVNSVK